MPEALADGRVSRSPESAEKQAFFDRYWVTRDYQRTDRRTMERAQLIWSRLARRQGTALDVGCGRGLFASFLSEQGLIVDATDISPQAVELTAQRGIHSFLTDLETQRPIGVYDLVFCLEVLQQVRDPLTVLTRLADTLAHDGELVVSVPNEFHLVRRLCILLGRPDMGDIEDSHLKFFTPERGRDLLERAGLRIRTTAHTAIMPPRPRALAQFGQMAASLWPSGLALSTIFFATKVRP